MKREFQNLAIDFWVHRGRLGVSQPSLCLFRDCAQKECMTPLLDVLTELEAECPSRRTLTFARCSRPSPLERLKLMVVSQREDLKIMNIRCHASNATVEMTATGLSLVTAAVATWQAGAEDFGISPRHSELKKEELGELDLESGELWFWGPHYAGP